MAGEKRSWWVADEGEVSAIWSTFGRGEYLGPEPPEIRLAIDLGANMGIATAWLLSRHPSARVIAVEPDPITAQRLQRNVGGSRVEIVEAAISDRDGTSMLARSRLSWTSHLVGDSNASEVGQFPVETLTLGTLRERYAPGENIDLLKIDIEGGEWRVLAQPLDGVSAVVVEVHESPTERGGSRARLEDVARRNGFRLSRGAGRDIYWLVRD